VSHVILIISKEFMTLILISFIAAVPVTWFLITKWLENFTQKVSIEPINFVMAGLAVCAVAWLTISYLSFKAAISNPTKALRNE
jgi:putative ABC transport system permease protein